jgi:DNA-nicking Smr family endonuclease
MTLDKPRRRAAKQLSDDDHRVWATVTRSIKPLRRRPPNPDPQEAAAEARPERLRPAKPSRSVHPAGEVPQVRVSVAPALAPLAKRERQRLARGGLPIDARIDLHGLTQSEAHAALARFLRRAQADDARFVLVITGKGAGLGARFADHDSDFGADRGVLRRQVPLWLRLPEFRSYVVGFEDADTAHGGQGALYVRLRRRR